MPNFGRIGDLVEIKRIGVEELSVEWRIKEIWDVLSWPGGCDVLYESPEFRIGNERWFLSMQPNWKRDDVENLASGWLKLNLDRCDGGLPKTFHISVGIRGSGGVEMESDMESMFLGNEFCGWDEFCLRSELMEDRTRLIPDGILNIMCILNRPSTARGIEKAMEDFGNLLASGENSDVTVQVKGAEFRVHRLILSARSPDFSAMFRAANKITIEDCEPEVFKEFLQYLYTGSIQSLDEQNVFDMYRVADKYLADNLKKQCLERMQDTLCIHTFCKVVQLALTQGESDLFEEAITFAGDNIREIIRTTEWQNFIREYPTEANEVLVKTLGPQGSFVV